MKYMTKGTIASLALSASTVEFKITPHQDYCVKHWEDLADKTKTTNYIALIGDGTPPTPGLFVKTDTFFNVSAGAISRDELLQLKLHGTLTEFTFEILWPSLTTAPPPPPPQPPYSLVQIRIL